MTQYDASLKDGHSGDAAVTGFTGIMKYDTSPMDGSSTDGKITRPTWMTQNDPFPRYGSSQWLYKDNRLTSMTQSDASPRDVNRRDNKNTVIAGITQYHTSAKEGLTGADAVNSVKCHDAVPYLCRDGPTGDGAVTGLTGMTKLGHFSIDSLGSLRMDQSQLRSVTLDWDPQAYKEVSVLEIFLFFLCLLSEHVFYFHSVIVRSYLKPSS